jgi:2-polyprenyl-6-methoxyphenol hydroxylase-like FAD-dependent oxidoreductase
VTRQADLERHLEAALERAGGRVLWSHGVHQVRPGADQVSVTLDKYSVDTLGYSVQHTAWVVSKTRELEFPFVIGADGIRSTVRNRLAIGFPEVATAADFAVFEFKTDADLGDEMRLVFTADSTNVCWPLPDGYCRWSFQIPRDPGLTDPREKERHFGIVGGGKYPVLDEQHLHDFLAQRAPWFKGSVEAVRWQMEVRFENRLAESFGEGRVWLAGDAGHATGPGGVQSMNVGLREAHDLAGIVAGVLGGEASLEAFGQYQHARREEWTRLLEFDQGLLATRSTDPWVAGIRKRLLPCIPASGEDLEQLAAQVGLEAAWV